MAYSIEQIAAHKVQIYALIDPRTGAVRYIGKANDANARLRSHLRDCRRRKTPVYAWVTKLVRLGLCPSVAVLAECPAAEWQDFERKYIREAVEGGAKLLNVAAGGDEPFCSREQRQANGQQVALLRTSTERKRRIYELKREMGRLLKDGLVSEEQKAKLRLAAAKAPHLFGKWASL